MAKKTEKKERTDFTDLPVVRTLKEETVQTIAAIAFFVLAIFLVLSAFDKGGLIGTWTYDGFHRLFGIGYYVLPILLIILGISFLKILRGHFVASKAVGSFIFMLSSLGLIDLLTKRGGWVGHLIATPTYALLDFTASIVFLLALTAISLITITDTHITLESIKSLFTDDDEEETEEKENAKKKKASEMEDEEVEAKIAPQEKETPKEEKPADQKKETAAAKIKKTVGISKEETEGGTLPIQFKSFVGKPFTPPPLNLLERDKGKPGVGDIKANANIIKRTLANFGIDVEMDEISIGPTVTRYALKPAEGIKLSRIVGLQNDLALALAAHPIRIEAPIPGKSLVGIEIPNTTKTMVGLGSLFSTDEYQASEKPLLVGLGKGISGKSHFANVAKMPHLLIAGTTGSGKSVTIHTLITSLLYRNSPESLKFIMIDPKRVELTLYNKIPHLLTPVITEAKKAILALKWAAKEMDRRYDILETESVRDIESYHKNVLAPALKKYQEEQAKRAEEGEIIDENGISIEGAISSKLPETMPYIVVIIDELADIMTTYPRELESAIVRLAQMSRAVGIHLILSTQRPSVNVITGLIKANIPSRLALQVSSQIDSRTILDMGGAEKLLGAGDMLYLSGEMSQPQRIQSAYISENEVKSVVKYLVDSYKDEIPGEVNISSAEHERNPIFEGSIGDDAASEEDDDMYEDAKEVVLEAGKASTSYIQRKLRIGYARAARIMDMLEERGVIGPSDGAKPREVMGGGGSSQSGSSGGEQESLADEGFPA